MKQLFATQTGVSRFRQRLLVEDGLREIQDEEFFPCAQVRVQLLKLEFWPPDMEKNQEIISASRNNDLITVETMLQCPRTPNVTDPEKMTPLHHAAQNGHIGAVYLLEAGAEKDQMDNGSVVTVTPLHLAQEGHLEVVRFLFEVGADKDRADKEGTTPLFVAAENGHLELLRFLIQVGCDKDKADTTYGFTPLLATAQKGHIDIVRLLVDTGADKDQPVKETGAVQHHCALQFSTITWR